MNISSILDIATAQVTAGDQHLRWVAPRNSSIVHLKSNVSGQIKSLDLRDICNIELKYLKAFLNIWFSGSDLIEIFDFVVFLYE